MSDKKIVLHLITSLNIGGTERFLQDLVLGSRKDYIHKVGYLKECGSIGEALKRQGMEVVKLVGFRDINKYLKELNPALIHTHLYRANIIGRIIGKINGIPVVSSRRSTDTWRKWHFVLLDVLTARLCKRIISNSENVAKLMVNREMVPENKIDVVYVGIPTGWFTDKIEEKVKGAVGFVGRLHSEKGADLLPKFADMLNVIFPEIKIKIAGGGELYDNLYKKIPENCSMLGWLEGDALKKFYDSIDILVLLSRLESFPRVLIEAGARGIPAVAPDIGGITEFVRDGVNGYIYKKGDIEEAAKKIFIHMNKNAYKKKKMSVEVLKTARSFTKEKTIREIIEIYDKILSKGRLKYKNVRNMRDN